MTNLHTNYIIFDSLKTTKSGAVKVLHSMTLMCCVTLPNDFVATSKKEDST